MVVPNSHITNTVLLQCPDVGNNNPASGVKPGGGSRSACPPGSVGTMNTGLRDYARNGATGDGKPSPYDIGRFDPAHPLYGYPYRNADGSTTVYSTGLAGLFMVQPDTVRRWFNMPTPPTPTNPNGIPQSPRNCVPISAVNKRPFTLPLYDGKSFQHTGNDGNSRAINRPGAAARVLFAAAMCARDTDAAGGVLQRPCTYALGRAKRGVSKSIPMTVEAGGLQRFPIFTKGDAKNGGAPWLYIVERANLADTVNDLWNIYRLPSSDPLKQQGWVQITIEPHPARNLWTGKLLYFYYYSSQHSDYDEVATQEQKGNVT